MANDDFIMVIDDVLPKSLCENIISTFEQSPNKSQGSTGGGVDPAKKRSTDIYFSEVPEFSDAFKQVMAYTSEGLQAYLKEYYCALVGPISLMVKHPTTGQPVQLDADNFEEVGMPNLAGLANYLFRSGRVNVQKYDKQTGGYPYWHSEVFPQSGHNEALHRVLLWMFYLNDVEEGGTTDFFYQKRSVKPKAGRMVIAPAYFTHTHRGQMPISNDKYILTSWILFNRAEQIYSAR